MSETTNITHTALIEKFSHDGRGIARINGKTTFIQGALPNEVVSFEYTRKKRDFDEGRVLSILTASPNRAEPRCPHYERCGGCSLQHLSEQSQIYEKQEQLLDMLKRIGHCQSKTILPVLKSNSWNYRNKARLSVRYVNKKKATLVGFREKNNPRYITEINQCPILNQHVDKHLGSLRQLLDSLDNPNAIAQVEVAAGDDEVALIFRNLEPLSSADKQRFCQFGAELKFRIFLQPGGMDSIKLLYPHDENDFLFYKLTKENIKFVFHPTDFTQVNAGLNQLMVERSLELMEVTSDDVILDLFCGLGNFSLPLAKYAKHVIGVEGSATMVSRAENNAKENGLSNVSFFCADLEKKGGLAHLVDQSFNKILLDPPRAGALEIVNSIDQFKALKRIVYVSCNPATFARDSDILVNQKKYTLRAVGVMDMFPHTAHVESIALFER